MHPLTHAAVCWRMQVGRCCKCAFVWAVAAAGNKEKGRERTKSWFRVVSYTLTWGDMCVCVCVVGVLNTCIYMLHTHARTHTHTNTHTHICLCMCVCVCVCHKVCSMRSCCMQGCIPHRDVRNKASGHKADRVWAICPDVPLDNTDTFSTSSLALAAFSVLIRNHMPAYLSQRRGSEQLFALSFVFSVLFVSWIGV